MTGGSELQSVEDDEEDLSSAAMSLLRLLGRKHMTYDYCQL